MTATQLRTMWQARPFVPFRIMLPGGKSLDVNHPEFLSISPSGRIALVWQNRDNYTAVDVFLITALAHAQRTPKRRRS